MDNRKYYWIKLKTDFFNTSEIDFLLSQKNGCEYIVLYQMLCLQTANNNGCLSSNMGEMIIPYNIDKIVRDTKYFTHDTVAVALELFKKLGLIYEQEEDKILRISNIENITGCEAGNANAQRQRRFRERQKSKKLSVTINNALCNDMNNADNNLSVTNRNENRNVDIDKEIDIELDKDKEIDNNSDKSSSLSKKKKSKLDVYEIIKENITIERINNDIGLLKKLEDSINGFIEMRALIKKPLTERALRLNINEALKIADGDIDTVIQIFNQSTKNSYQGVFPLKNNNTATVHMTKEHDKYIENLRRKLNDTESTGIPF